MEGSPKVLAARERVRQASARRREVFGFFDPSVELSGTKYDGLEGHDFDVRGGIEKPLLPGVYLNAGFEENYLANPVPRHDRLFQTALTAGIRVPLLRNRGFRGWRYRHYEAEAQHLAAVNGLLAVMQDLRYTVEQRHIGVQEAFSSYRATQAATRRVEKLLAEGLELVRLQVVPEYQLFPARLEVAIAKADELRALQVCEESVVRLAQHLGDLSARDVSVDPSALIRLAEASALPESYTIEAALGHRGVYLELFAETEAVRMQLNQDREELRPDLSLRADTVWQGEDPTNPLGHDHYLSDRHVGAVVSLTWKRPLRYRAEKARVEIRQARLAELSERMREVRLEIEAAFEMSERDFELARERLGLVTEAVQQAEKTLAAEEERFRLGEGRSRNVLDAQKDLTNVAQRQTRIAAVLLRARSAFMHAAGYGGVAPDQTGRVPAQ